MRKGFLYGLGVLFILLGIILMISIDYGTQSAAIAEGMIPIAIGIICIVLALFKKS